MALISKHLQPVAKDRLTAADNQRMGASLLATELHQLQKQITLLLHEGEMVAEFPTPSTGDADTYVSRFLTQLSQLLKALR